MYQAAFMQLLFLPMTLGTLCFYELFNPYINMLTYLADMTARLSLLFLCRSHA